MKIQCYLKGYIISLYTWGFLFDRKERGERERERERLEAAYGGLR